LAPDRLDVLANYRIRFTQRKLFQDDHELQPDYEAFGTAEEIERYLRFFNVNPAPGLVTQDVIARLIVANPLHQQSAIETAVRNITSIDNMGILCLTLTPRSEQMWNEYADGGASFVIAFDTSHPGFRALTKPTGVGIVTYSAEGFPSFLGMMEKDVFGPLFHKRLEYAFEKEWRSIRLLKDLEAHPDGVFLGTFDPGVIVEVIHTPTCAVQRDLRKILAREEYKHVRIVRA
jgi:hypothetical protein